MTQETKKRIKSALSLIFFPITGFYSLIKECKKINYESFIVEWFNYVFFLILWMVSVFLILISICGLIYHFSYTIIPVGFVAGFIFIFIILPKFIFKIFNKK